MSHILDTAAKIHDAQLKAAQSAVSAITGAAAKAAGTVDQVGDNAPSLPSFLAGPVDQIKDVVTSVVGTRTEVFDYLEKSSDDWAGVRKNLRSGLVGAVTK